MTVLLPESTAALELKEDSLMAAPAKPTGMIQLQDAAAAAAGAAVEAAADVAAEPAPASVATAVGAWASK